MSFVERLIITCPYLGESTVGGSTVTVTDRRGCNAVSVPEQIRKNVGLLHEDWIH